MRHASSIWTRRAFIFLLVFATVLLAFWAGSRRSNTAVGEPDLAPLRSQLELNAQQTLSSDPLLETIQLEVADPEATYDDIEQLVSSAGGDITPISTYPLAHRYLVSFPASMRSQLVAAMKSPQKKNALGEMDANKTGGQREFMEVVIQKSKASAQSESATGAD